MKSLISLVTLVVLAVTTSLASPLALAEKGDGKYCDHHKGGHHRQHGQDHFMHKLYGLNLTEAQKKKIEEIRTGAQPVMMEHRQKIHTVKMEMREIVLSDKFDQEKIKSLARKKADLMAELMVARANMKNRMYQVLTARQKQELKSITKQKGNDGGKEG